MKNATSEKTAKKLRNPAGTAQISATSVHECLMAENIFEVGLGSVWISRKLPNGKLSVGVFLLDVFCLGVKNAMLSEKISLSQYKTLQMMSLGETLAPVQSCCAKKLVLGAVAYAENLGFKPHADYEATRGVMEGIEIENCAAEFEFGQDGKPLYIPGPDETPKMVEHIVDQLRKSCGEDGFEVMTEDDMADEEEEYTMTIDNPEKTERLMEGLERLLPFQATFEEKVWQHLVKESKVPRGMMPSVSVEKLSYSGDYGGILCHLAEHSLVCSLTHLRFAPAFFLSREIAAYQKLRVKKLKKQAAA